MGDTPRGTGTGVGRFELPASCCRMMSADIPCITNTYTCNRLPLNLLYLDDLA